MRNILITALLFLALALPALAGVVTLLEPGDKVVAQVLSVTDGDSLVVEVRGLRVAVRMAGVDCPEWNAPGGKAAKSFTSKWLDRNKTVILEAAQDCYTKKPDCWDRYGRLLAWVWRDGHLLQEDLVHTGHAEIKYIKKHDKYYARLQAAKE